MLTEDMVKNVLRDLEFQYHHLKVAGNSTDKYVCAGQISALRLVLEVGKEEKVDYRQKTMKFGGEK